MLNIKSINPITQNNGPGIRVEVILSSDGISLTPNQLVDRIRKFRPYFELDNGGVTFLGIFDNKKELSETCYICHKAGINTCIKLNDYNFEYDEILKYIDIVLLNDDKYIDIISNKFNNIKIVID